MLACRSRFDITRQTATPKRTATMCPALPMGPRSRLYTLVGSFWPCFSGNDTPQDGCSRCSGPTHASEEDAQ
eukprot:5370220-Pyramimonas_sp.AAC.1